MNIIQNFYYFIINFKDLIILLIKSYIFEIVKTMDIAQPNKVGQEEIKAENKEEIKPENDLGIETGNEIQSDPIKKPDDDIM